MCLGRRWDNVGQAAGLLLAELVPERRAEYTQPARFALVDWARAGNSDRIVYAGQLPIVSQVRGPLPLQALPSRRPHSACELQQRERISAARACSAAGRPSASLSPPTPAVGLCPVCHGPGVCRGHPGQQGACGAAWARRGGTPAL